MLFPETYTTGYIGHVKDCTKNLPDEIFRYMKDNNQADIANVLRAKAAEVFNKVIKKDSQQSLITQKPK